MRTSTDLFSIVLYENEYIMKQNKTNILFINKPQTRKFNYAGYKYV